MIGFHKFYLRFVWRGYIVFHISYEIFHKFEIVHNISKTYSLKSPFSLKCLQFIVIDANWLITYKNSRFEEYQLVLN